MALPGVALAGVALPGVALPVLLPDGRVVTVTGSSHNHYVTLSRAKSAERLWGD